MSGLAPRVTAVDDASVARAIDEWLAGQRGAAIAALRRRRWEYATSAPLELVTVTTSDGREHDFVLKHLGPRQSAAHIRRARPTFVFDPAREISMYRAVLRSLGTRPSLVGCGMPPDAGSYWLLLEHLDGPRLAETGAGTAWTATAQWLGAFHARMDTIDRGAVRRAVPLIECDRSWYRVWMDRALRFFATEGPPRSCHDGKALRWLAGRYDVVIDHLLSLPSTVIHGEFYPLNVIVTRGPTGFVPCPIDWETAAIGPGVLDLATLVAGDWSLDDRRAMTAAYLAASGARGTLDELLESVAYAQIQRAVQCLGWFGRRRTPDVQARDWLADAIDLSDSLRL